MKSFFKEFLRDEPAGAGGVRQIFLGAFGKHPGWNDHMDDLGLETESLLAAMKRIYIDGIGSQISSGAWEKLAATEQIPFDHVFLWSRPPQLLLGRMWASRDGKGRSHYPMVVCAHSIGLPLEHVIQGVLPSLESICSVAARTKSPEEVRCIIEQSREALRGWITQTAAPPSALDARGFVAKIESSDAKDCLPTAFAALRRSPYLDGKFRDRPGQPAGCFRFPTVSRAVEDSLRFWSRFLRAQLDPAAPLFLAAPVNQYWLDAIAGEPAPANFFCLRTSPRVAPLLTDTPEELTPALIAETESFLEQLATNPELADGPEGARQQKSWLSRFFA